MTGDEAPSRGPDPIGAATDAATEAFESARERTAAARDAAADAAVEVAKKIPKPRFRGVSHQWAAFVSLPLGIALIVIASGAARDRRHLHLRLLALTALLGTSALYHRVNWNATARGAGCAASTTR